jgi:hypothetical protein
VGDSSPIRCKRKGQRLIVDSDGDYVEQSLEVLCQRTNDDRGENLCSRLQTLYKLVQETESKRDIAPPEVSPTVGRERSLPRILPDVRPTLRLGEQTAAKVAFDGTAVDRQTLPGPFGLLTATTGNFQATSSWTSAGFLNGRNSPRVTASGIEKA